MNEEENQEAAGEATAIAKANALARANSAISMAVDEYADGHIFQAESYTLRTGLSFA